MVSQRDKVLRAGPAVHPPDHPPGVCLCPETTSSFPNKTIATFRLLKGKVRGKYQRCGRPTQKKMVTKRQPKTHTKLRGHSTKKEPGAEVRGLRAGWDHQASHSPTGFHPLLGHPGYRLGGHFFLAYLTPQAQPVSKTCTLSFHSASGVFSVLSVPAATRQILSGWVPLAFVLLLTGNWQESCKRTTHHSSLLSTKQYPGSPTL